ncbi:hypothetical protein D3C81_1797730 [compost metagenome]
MLDTAEAALVFGNIKRTRSEAPRGIGKRQTPPDKHFKLRHWCIQRVHARLNIFKQFAPLLDTRHPTHQAILDQQLQSAVIIDIQCRPADEGQAPLAAQPHC